MKKIITIAAAVVLTTSAWAQAPQKMSYQAVVRDVSNNLTTNQAVGMQISILQGAATGTAVYVETQTPTTNANGLVSLEIGSGAVVSGDFTTIDWANDTYFIKTETDPTGGTNYTITGTSQLMSVPYALHANVAESIAGGGSTDKFYLGQDTLGGIVFYIYKDATGTQHGLIVSKTESTAQWQTTGTTTNADRTEDGAYNMGLMTGSPAKTYVTGLGDGWYLPSIDELALLYYNRFTTNKALRAGGFTLLSTANYWSSTETTPTIAFYFSFYLGHAYYNGKSLAYSVRAVRAF